MCSMSLSERVAVVRRDGECPRDAVGQQRRRDAATCELEEPAPTDVRHPHHQPDVHGRRPCAAQICDTTGRGGPVRLSVILCPGPGRRPSAYGPLTRGLQGHGRPRLYDAPPGGGIAPMSADAARRGVAWPARGRRRGSRRRARRRRRWCRPPRPPRAAIEPSGKRAPRAPSLITQVASKLGDGGALGLGGEREVGAERVAAGLRTRSAPTSSMSWAEARSTVTRRAEAGRVDARPAPSARAAGSSPRRAARRTSGTQRRIELGPVKQRGDAAIGGHRPLRRGRRGPTRPRRRGPPRPGRRPRRR